jgi:hypothetical protein
LDKARYFVLGCDDLIIAVDHKPLLKIFSDRSLEDISNSRLRNLKEKTPHVTDLTASESSEDTAGMIILVSMSVTSDSESEVCMPDKNDVAGSNDIVSFLMAAMSTV